MEPKALRVVGILLILGCDRAPVPAPRRPTASTLSLTSEHVVVSPDLIRGVLTIRNFGARPIAIIERWNSWGAYQWRFQVGAESAGNPQCAWWANFYTELVLAPGEVRHARFRIVRSRSQLQTTEDGWNFLLDGTSTFESGQSIVLMMTDAAPEEQSDDPNWSGCLSVSSNEIESFQDLEDRVVGKPLR